MMLQRTAWVCLVTGLVLVGGAVPRGMAQEHSAEEAQSPAAAAFAQIVALEGTWTGTASHAGSDEASPLTLIYTVTGGGSAVIERQFVGTPHEMTTVYHLDGDRLMLTHYCAAGNQPRMVCDGPDAEGRLAFRFLDVTNLAGPDAVHIHEAVVDLSDPDRLRSEWVGYVGGEPAMTARFDVVREAADASDVSDISSARGSAAGDTVTSGDSAGGCCAETP